MRTLSLTLLAALTLAAAGCEKTIHEARRDGRELPRAATAAEPQEPRAVPAVDGVPIA